MLLCRAGKPLKVLDECSRDEAAIRRCLVLPYMPLATGPVSIKIGPFVASPLRQPAFPLSEAEALVGCNLVDGLYGAP
jgi:hypothetical protein